ncbi:GAF domain-containing protein [Actinomadura sp. KC06]|uniref:ATP-binding SpoIIE family protein phosphatase n=1 Tax=Actinomadura sp. KC06 TaxID=2530369 RepID=UPI00104C5E5E|nr:SpoIIE family protein phosphatase [Actinomadura sp. KC06]TDD27802.1 GAF domain-containing protein [Actinomadura sp. KC06]
MGGKAGRKWGSLRGEYAEICELAKVLRDIADGRGVTVRALAEVMPYARATIAQNLNGSRRPSWDFVSAFLNACAGRDDHSRLVLEGRVRPLWEAADPAHAQPLAEVTVSSGRDPLAVVPAELRGWVAALRDAAETQSAVDRVDLSIARHEDLTRGLTEMLGRLTQATELLTDERNALRQDLVTSAGLVDELARTRIQLADTQRRLAATERLQAETARRLDEALRQRDEGDRLMREALFRADHAWRRLSDLEQRAESRPQTLRGDRGAMDGSVAALMGQEDQELASEVLRRVDGMLDQEGAALGEVREFFQHPTSATTELSFGQRVDNARTGEAGQVHGSIADRLDDLRVGGSLDLDQSARGLVEALVPHFCTTASVLVLESLLTADVATTPIEDSAVMRRMAIACEDGAWRAVFPVGEVLIYPKGTPQRECVDTARILHLPTIEATKATAIARAWRRSQVAELLTEASMVLLPLVVNSTLIGLIACVRTRRVRRFDGYDVEAGRQFADRAAIIIDNARMIARERTTALALQRSLLPTRLSAPDAVEVRHRYLPSSKLIGVGGDWYDSIALPGARVVFIIGDVAGHGVRAAITMGRLRASLQTLAHLEYPPAEALREVNELMIDLGEREPHFATCLYAIYDAVNSALQIASCGHLPPLLITPDGNSGYLEVPLAAPLGVVDEMEIKNYEIQVDENSIFVLYTNGLVNESGRDISDGLTWLRDHFEAKAQVQGIGDLATDILGGINPSLRRDDIAALIARLGRLAENRRVSWILAESSVDVPSVQRLVRNQLREWDLDEISATTEQLAVELVTNSLRFASGPLKLQLLYERVLTCEVHDSSPALPQLAGDKGSGHGWPLVVRLAHRWGTRPTTAGRVVWFELPLPK